MRTQKCAFILLLVLLAVPATAQPSLQGDVTKARAAYGAKMTPADVGRMLNAIAWQHRAEGWGVLAKGYGTNCPSPVGPIACDILVHAPSGQHFDVLEDAENLAIPQWGNKGPIDMSRFLAPVDPGQTAPGATVPPPTTTGGADIGPLLARVESLERAVQALATAMPSVEATVAQHDNRIAVLAELLAALQTDRDELATRITALEGRTIPVGCSAALNLGATRVPISCRLQ